MLVMANIHNDVTETADLRPPEGFGKKITDHLVGWSVLDGDVLALQDVCHEKISDVHVPRSLAAGRAPVCL